MATLELISQRRGELTLPVRNEAKLLMEQRGKLMARIEACTASADGTSKTRYHGDYHLGQVLLARNDFLIIDFEGEPARGLAHRRGKHSPLRDVAGMLRSFNYAHWTALRRAVQANEDAIRLAPLARGWETAVRSEFLKAYDETARGGGFYGSFEGAHRLLDLFEMEKAFYELRYELNNRPGWVSIPLQGILALAELA